MYQQGFESAQDLATVDLETLLDIEGISPERAASILQATKEHVETLMAAQQEAEAQAVDSATEESVQESAATDTEESVQESAATDERGEADSVAEPAAEDV